MLRTSPANLEIQKATLSGRLLGIGFILLGGLMCLTLIGALFGVPLILFGVSLQKDARAYRGECPACGSELLLADAPAGQVPAGTCDRCKSRVTLQGRQFQTNVSWNDPSHRSPE